VNVWRAWVIGERSWQRAIVPRFYFLRVAIC